MSIKNRIVFSSLLMIILFLMMGALNWHGTKSVMNKTNMAYLLEHGNMQLQGTFRGINEFIIDEGEPLSIVTNTHLKGFEDVFQVLAEKTENSDLEIILTERVGPLWKTVKGGAVSFMKNNPYISVDDDEAMLQYGKLTTKAKALLQEVDSIAKQTLEDAKATQKRTRNITYVAGLIIIMLISSILINLYISITSPVRELSLVAEGFDNGDLSILMNDSRKDEFGMLGGHLNEATAKLSDMISNVTEGVHTLNANSETLSATVGMIAGNSRNQSDQTTQAAAAMEEMSASYADVAKNTAEVAESAKEVNELAFKSADVISGTVNSINNIAKSIKESADDIEELGKGSELIGDVVNVIDDIAGQTNLLALNAAIEAARAGEHGRGFAVVADEVRKLAEKTASSTKEIGEMIKGIQGNTGKTIKSLETWKKDVDLGIEQASEAGDALQMIVVSVNSVTEKVQQIAAAAEEQSNTGHSVTANVESVAGISEQTAEAAQKSSDAVNELNVLARHLQHLVGGFRLRKENRKEEVNGAEEGVSKAGKDTATPEADSA
jgi:methyl-accepting chemotaxis protein